MLDDSDRGTGMKQGGLTLEQFAGVSAALADGISLDEVLAQEQIDAAAWPDAERLWRQCIAESADLQLDHANARRVAEDCLARELAPLDSDPAAWVGLLSALSAGRSREILPRLGLNLSDIGRLGRLWRTKAEQQPEVAKQLESGEGTLPDKITVGSPVLRPFPWTLARAPSEPSPASSSEQRLLELQTLEEPVRCFATYQLEARERTKQDAEKVTEVASPDDTALMPSAYQAPPALPFGTFKLSKKSDETLPIPAPVKLTYPSSGSFRDALAPVAVPMLSLEDYAALQAALVVGGDSSVDTLRSFGILSASSYAALRGHFSQLFQEDLDAQSRFLRMVAGRLVRSED